MLRTTALVASLIVATHAAPAIAADMPGHSRIGKIFAEPSRPSKQKPVEIEPHDDRHALLIPRKVPGYYGRPTDFQQRTYYGTTRSFVYDYIPLVCEALATCNVLTRH